MDLLAYYWSEVDSGIKIKYSISIIFGHAKAQDVVTEIIETLEKLAIPLKLMFLLKWMEQR